MQQYLDHCKEIITSDYSGFKGGSKGSGLISLFGYQNSYDLKKGFPILTTKKMAIKSIIHELIWFLKGDTNIKYLEDNKTFHGDIKPTTIMFDKKKQVKLIDSYLVNLGKTAFELILENQKSESFLTP